MIANDQRLHVYTRTYERVLRPVLYALLHWAYQMRLVDDMCVRTQINSEEDVQHQVCVFILCVCMCVREQSTVPAVYLAHVLVDVAIGAVHQDKRDTLDVMYADMHRAVHARRTCLPRIEVRVCAMFMYTQCRT